MNHRNWPYLRADHRPAAGTDDGLHACTDCGLAARAGWRAGRADDRSPFAGSGFHLVDRAGRIPHDHADQQVAAMKRDAVCAFSPQMIAAIYPRSAAGLTTDKIAALDTGQTAALKPEQPRPFPIIRSMRLGWIRSRSCRPNRSAVLLRWRRQAPEHVIPAAVARHRVIDHPAHDCGHQD